MLLVTGLLNLLGIKQMLKLLLTKVKLLLLDIIQTDLLAMVQFGSAQCWGPYSFMMHLPVVGMKQAPPEVLRIVPHPLLLLLMALVGMTPLPVD